MRRTHYAAVAVLVVAALPALAQPPKEEFQPEPEFVDWSRFKKGTSITFKVTETKLDVTTETKTTITLAELTAGHLVLETLTIVNPNAPTETRTTTKREVKRDSILPKGLVVEADLSDPDRPGPHNTKQGTEKIKVGEIEFKTNWLEHRVNKNESTTITKTWYSETIPASIVKREVTVLGKESKVVRSSKTELVEFKKP